VRFDPDTAVHALFPPPVLTGSGSMGSLTRVSARKGTPTVRHPVTAFPGPCQTSALVGSGSVWKNSHDGHAANPWPRVPDFPRSAAADSSGTLIWRIVLNGALRGGVTGDTQGLAPWPGRSRGVNQVVSGSVVDRWPGSGRSRVRPPVPERQSFFNRVSEKP